MVIPTPLKIIPTMASKLTKLFPVSESLAFMKTFEIRSADLTAQNSDSIFSFIDRLAFDHAEKSKPLNFFVQDYYIFKLFIFFNSHFEQSKVQPELYGLAHLGKLGGDCFIWRKRGEVPVPRVSIQ